MSYDLPDPKLGHPDAAIRLASAVHRFRVPVMTKTVSYERSFRTTGTHTKTRTVLLKADSSRKQLKEALDAKTISGERVYNEATRYLPLIQQLLLTCQVQPEVARLDERLIFEWQSGVEKDPQPFTSEALMYDVVMTIGCQALGKAATATEASIAGDFAAASRSYATAAGMMEFLATDHLPKWIAKGSNVVADQLPTEATIGAAAAFGDLLLANGQQMAVATVLMKPGTPNYGLLAKLCMGIVERLENFVSAMRKSSFTQMNRMDPDFFTLVTFQINLQKSLLNYFYARSLWDSQEYGLSIATLNEAKQLLNTRKNGAAAGMPDITKTSPLKPLQGDLTDLKAHMVTLLKHYERDNSTVYFERVPEAVPEGKKLQTAVQLTKPVPYKLADVEPLPLTMPGSGGGGRGGGMGGRSDSDLARELQRQLNS